MVSKVTQSFCTAAVILPPGFAAPAAAAVGAGAGAGAVVAAGAATAGTAVLTAGAAGGAATGTSARRVQAASPRTAGTLTTSSRSRRREMRERGTADSMAIPPQALVADANNEAAAAPTHRE